MKLVALGLRNWMFIGSVDAGYRAPDLMSLVSGAEHNDLNVCPYVSDVLSRLLAGDTNYESLWSDVCKQADPEGVRIYRVEERRLRADAQSIKRARRRLAKRR